MEKTKQLETQIQIQLFMSLLFVCIYHENNADIDHSWCVAAVDLLLAYDVSL